LKTALVTLKTKLQMLNMLGIIKRFTSLNVKRTSDTGRQTDQIQVGVSLMFIECQKKIILK